MLIGLLALILVAETIGVIFAGPSERIEFSHRAENRTIFAHGAARATLWAKNQKPGLYSMTDVLGL